MAHFHKKCDTLVQSKKGFKKSLVRITAEGSPALAAFYNLHLLSKLARWTLLSSVCLQEPASAEKAQHGFGWHHLLLAREVSVLTWIELPLGLLDLDYHRFLFLIHLFSPLRDKNCISFSIIMALAACSLGITLFHSNFEGVTKWVTVTSEPDWTYAGETEKLHSSASFLVRPAPSLAEHDC